MAPTEPRYYHQIEESQWQTPSEWAPWQAAIVVCTIGFTIGILLAAAFSVLG